MSRVSIRLQKWGGLDVGCDTVERSSDGMSFVFVFRVSSFVSIMGFDSGLSHSFLFSVMYHSRDDVFSTWRPAMHTVQ